MFGSNPKAVPPSATPAPAPAPVKTERPAPDPAAVKSRNLLSSGVSITGDVTFGDDLVIDGEVEGSIKSKGALTVGEHGRIRGEIRAGSVTIKGTVEGNVFVSDRCALEAGATLRGDIEAPRLAVDENAAFFGSAKISAKRG
jgi:cytoskeletal protein CcmA (bactofilin family)